MAWYENYHAAYNNAMCALETGGDWIPLEAATDWHHMLDMGGEL